MFFPEEGEHDEIPPSVKAKIDMYLVWAAGYKDIMVQQMGIVVVIGWFTLPSHREHDQL